MSRYFTEDHEWVDVDGEIGTVGMTQAEALAAHGAVDVYRSQFRPMKHTLSGRDEKMLMKILKC